MDSIVLGYRVLLIFSRKIHVTSFEDTSLLPLHHAIQRVGHGLCLDLIATLVWMQQIRHNVSALLSEAGCGVL